MVETLFQFRWYYFLTLLISLGQTALGCATEPLGNASNEAANLYSVSEADY
jgi:hypothetical protein